MPMASFSSSVERRSQLAGVLRTVGGLEGGVDGEGFAVKQEGHESYLAREYLKGDSAKAA